MIKVIVILFCPLMLHASEGMWLPLLLQQLNESEMQSMGMKISAEDIYSVNQSSLKDAVVLFGGGCTGEVISAEGLMLTNHHCGYWTIQNHSSVEHDYLTDGFWAKNRSEELSNPGLTATFIIRIEDVSDRILEGVTDTMTANLREKVIAANIIKVRKESLGDSTHYKAVIKPFYHGNKYYLFITETFLDVRLVGAPPSAIGKFGGDVDNWMWPRHTGDFSLFRIYAGKDNKPAEYSADNVPFKPRHFLPISLKGVEKGDFTMVFGFPGFTSEYLTSFAVALKTNKINPARIAMRKLALDIIEAQMKISPELRIKYSAKQAGISNYYKKYIGESRGLLRNDALNKKVAREEKFSKTVEGNDSLKKQYGELLAEFEKHYQEQEKFALMREYFDELVSSGPEIISFANGFEEMIRKTQKDSQDSLTKEDVLGLISTTRSQFRDYDLNTDKLLLAKMLQEYCDNADKELGADVCNLVSSKYNGNFTRYAEMVFSRSILSDSTKIIRFLDSYPKLNNKKLKQDPAFELSESVYSSYFSRVAPYYKFIQMRIDSLQRIYMKALMELSPDERFYPDANHTMRVAYGNVSGYSPLDGVAYNYFTTLDGIIEKEDSANPEFIVPAKLSGLYHSKDFGQYGKNGEMRVCFTASNHTTGGNSGSPVLNAEGQLIGINFDRNWEGTMSDVMYDPDRTRNISVDIRYVLFIIDKFAGAGHLVSEMELVR